jgi:hypothetical protein
MRSTFIFKIRILRLVVTIKNHFKDARTYTRNWQVDPVAGLFLAAIVSLLLWYIVILSSLFTCNQLANT